MISEIPKYHSIDIFYPIEQFFSDAPHMLFKCHKSACQEDYSTIYEVKIITCTPFLYLKCDSLKFFKLIMHCSTPGIVMRLQMVFSQCFTRHYLPPYST